MNEVPMTRHAQSVIDEKGFDPAAVAKAWRDPEVTYPSGIHEGQHKRIGGGLAVVCDDVTGKVITVFEHKVETALRKDQQDAAALKWARKNGLL